MRFAFTENQLLSRRTLRELLEKSCSAEQVRAAWSNESGRVPELWSKLVEFGVVGITAPAAHGGMGLGELDLVLLLEEAGRAALPEPILETTAVAIPLLAELTRDARCAALLERAAQGRAIAVVGLETMPYVPSADVADALVMQHRDEAHLLSKAEAELVPEPSVDRSRRLFRVKFRSTDSSCIARGADALRAFAGAFDRGALAAAAQLNGLAGRVLEMTIHHATTRRQFGQPIGAFQAVKHQLVDAYLGVAFARPLVYRAAHSLEHADPERALHVSAAKAFASDAAWKAARTALQVHGAIGYSYEHDLHLWMKRIWALAMAWGDAAWHRKRVASAILGEKIP